jgi:DNA repair protein RadB
MEKISTGSYDLNKWLSGGYEEDIITMVAGPPGSGKTNFAIMASCSQAKIGNKVLFVDTEGGFSIDRIKQIVGENYEDYLKNILLLEPTKFEEQKKIFSEMLNKVKKEHVNLIIVDGISMLYRLEIGENMDLKKENKAKIINKEMARQMRVLAEISRKKKIPIIITNQVYFDFLPEEDWKKGLKREMNIVGGDLFKYWSKCIIQLDNEKGKRKAFLLKHRSLPQKEMNFEIRDKGIFKRGFM